MPTRRLKLLAISAFGAGSISLAGCELNARPGAESLFTVFAEPTPTEAAEWAIDPYDADRRYQGTMLLGNKPFAGESVYIKLFLDNAKDEDPGVRAAAIRALGNHGAPENAPIIIAGLADEDPLVRLWSARALQRIYSEDAIEPLMKISGDSGDPDAEVRAESVCALGQYAQGRVVQHLVSTLTDPSLAVNENAINSLRILTGQDFGFDRRGWQDWYDATDDLFAARSAFVYPAYDRSRKWYEYIPFVPKPPNEPQGTPAGLPPMTDTTSGTSPVNP